MHITNASQLSHVGETIRKIFTTAKLEDNLGAAVRVSFIDSSHIKKMMLMYLRNR